MRSGTPWDPAAYKTHSFTLEHMRPSSELSVLNSLDNSGVFIDFSLSLLNSLDNSGVFIDLQGYVFPRARLTMSFIFPSLHMVTEMYPGDVYFPVRSKTKTT